MSRRRRLLPPILVVVLLAAACTGAAANSTPTPEESAARESPTPAVTGRPGVAVYVYANAGVVATLQLEDGAGTLEVVNRTGRELPRPDFYILDARDATRIEGTVEGAAPIPNGGTRTFGVSFPPMELKNIGLVVLLMGSDNYGAFTPR